MSKDSSNSTIQNFKEAARGEARGRLHDATTEVRLPTRVPASLSLEENDTKKDSQEEKSHHSSDNSKEDHAQRDSDGVSSGGLKSDLSGPSKRGSVSAIDFEDMKSDTADDMSSVFSAFTQKTSGTASSYHSVRATDLLEKDFKTELIKAEYVQNNSALLVCLIDAIKGKKVVNTGSITNKSSDIAAYSFEPIFTMNARGEAENMKGISYIHAGKKFEIVLEDQTINFYRYDSDDHKEKCKPVHNYDLLTGLVDKSNIEPLLEAFDIKREFARSFQKSWDRSFCRKSVIQTHDGSIPSSQISPRSSFNKIIFSPLESPGIWADSSFGYVTDIDADSMLTVKELRQEKIEIEQLLLNINAAIIEKFSQDESFVRKYHQTDLGIDEVKDLIRIAYNQGGVSNSIVEGVPLEVQPWQIKYSSLFSKECLECGVLSGASNDKGMRLTHLPVSVSSALEFREEELVFNEDKLRARKEDVERQRGSSTSQVERLSPFTLASHK